MIRNFVGFTLALAVVIHLWIIVTIYRQKVKSALRPYIIYLNVLFIIIEFSTIFFLQGLPAHFINVFLKIHFVTEVFIPPLMITLAQAYLDETKILRFSWKNVFLFGTSALLAGLTYFNFILIDLQSGVPKYSSLYWLVIAYFYLIFAVLFYLFLKRYPEEKRRSEIKNLKFALKVLLPISVLGFTLLKLPPQWGIYHPVILLTYAVFTVNILIMVVRFEIIETDVSVSRTFLFFLISVIYLSFLSGTLPPGQPRYYLISIPVLAGVLFLFRSLEVFAYRTLQQHRQEEEYELQDDLEILISETEKYIDNQALAQFIGELALKVLRCTKCAVINSRFDVKPYQITYVKEFPADQLESLISSSDSPFMETLEYNRDIINKFDLSRQSALFQVMDRYDIYLAIPLVVETNLAGLILIGGERKIIKISRKDLKFARFLSIKATHAFQNIQEIQKVVQSQKMADLGLVASQLAHDFQSFITLVKLDAREDSPLRQHANYMEKLVKDLMNYARPRELRLSRVNINHLIDMSLDLLSIPAGIGIEKHYSESIPQISIDEDQMRRVFINLFENSIAAMKNGRGRLKITTRPLRPLSTYRRNTWLYIEILDDGAGIPEEFLEKIFDPFFTTRKNSGGNGMGLAIVRQIISRHQGFIDVTSKLGKGTIFNIRLPYLR